MSGACSVYEGRGRRVQGFVGEAWGERDHWGDPSVDGRIILRRIFKKWGVGVWTESSCLKIGTGGGHL